MWVQGKGSTSPCPSPVQLCDQGPSLPLSIIHVFQTLKVLACHTYRVTVGYCSYNMCCQGWTTLSCPSLPSAGRSEARRRSHRDVPSTWSAGDETWSHLVMALGSPVCTREATVVSEKCTGQERFYSIWYCFKKIHIYLGFGRFKDAATLHMTYSTKDTDENV